MYSGSFLKLIISYPVVFICAWFGLFCCVSAVLPGISPTIYCTADSEDGSCQKEMHVYANRLNSDETVIPFSYSSFDFCEASDKVKSPSENLGQVVFGERIESSAYNFDFGKDIVCKEACNKTYKFKEYKTLAWAVRYNYQQHWILDNLPVLQCGPKTSSNRQCYSGFPLGCYQRKIDTPNKCHTVPKLDAKTYILYNHVDIIVTYHPAESEKKGKIVRVEAIPRSFLSSQCKGGPLVFPDKGKPKDFKFSYTYSVYFVANSSITWATRWDHILLGPHRPRIQWIGISISIVIVLFLSAMVAMILMRTLYRDIARYNQMEDTEDAQEEFGWKLIHGDVFRPPRKGMLFSVMFGSGVQTFFMTFVTLVLACFAFKSQAYRGAIATSALVLYVCFGALAGYASARLYKSFGGERWKFNVLCSAFVCPSLIFGIVLLLNLILWIKHSSAAIPFTTLLALLGLWFGISVPLTFIGAYFGFRKRAIEHPVRTNQIPRQIPLMSFYTRPLPGIMMGGILPFGCVFVQFLFILNSIWSHNTFSMFGLLFVVFLILVITCVESTILLCYFHLCAEDYHWWWRSFFSSGFTAAYFFIYCIYFFFSRLDMHGFTSGLLYFGYTLIMTFFFFLLTGTIGFISAFWFIRKIYGSVKID